MFQNCKNELISKLLIIYLKQERLYSYSIQFKGLYLIILFPSVNPVVW